MAERKKKKVTLLPSILKNENSDVQTGGISQNLRTLLMFRRKTQTKKRSSDTNVLKNMDPSTSRLSNSLIKFVQKGKKSKKTCQNSFSTSVPSKDSTSTELRNQHERSSDVVEHCEVSKGGDQLFSPPGVMSQGTIKKIRPIKERVLTPSKAKSDPQQSEDAGKSEKVTGDDLRKQLVDGLKGNGGKEKPNEEDKKEQQHDELKQEEKISIDAGAETVGVPVPHIAEQTAAVVPGAADNPTEDMLMPPAEGKREHLYKILVIGELGTGKTSIIKRYVHQFFSQHYRATIGVDFALKVIHWDENSIIRLQLWDIAGQERFGNMTRVYYKEAVGAFIVFDVTRAATFDAVLKWKQDLDSKVQLPDGTSIPCILLANKCDQPKEGIVNNSNKMDEFCREKGFAGWYETSAKENINIDEAAKSLVIKILQNDKLIRRGVDERDGDRIALGSSPDSGGKNCAC